jgi:GTP-binding nuclear protein Ran
LTRKCGHIPIIFVGNKVEIKGGRGKDDTFFRTTNLQSCDISAKANYNCEQPFLWLARKLTRNNSLRFEEAPGMPSEGDDDDDL